MMVINLRFVCQPQRGYTWPNEWSQCNKNVLWMNEGESVFFFSTSWWQLRTIFKKKTKKLINPAFFFLSLRFRWDDLKHQSTVRENNKRLKKKKSLTLRETMKAAQANHCRAHRLASFHWSAEKSWGTRLVLPHWSSACWSVWTSSGSGLKKKKIWYSFWFWLEANKMSADSPENLLYEETGRTGPELEEDEIDQPQAVLVILDSTEILNLVQWVRNPWNLLFLLLLLVCCLLS